MRLALGLQPMWMGIGRSVHQPQGLAAAARLDLLHARFKGKTRGRRREEEEEFDGFAECYLQLEERRIKERRSKQYCAEDAPFRVNTIESTSVLLLRRVSRHLYGVVRPDEDGGVVLLFSAS